MKSKRLNLFATGLLALGLSMFSCSGDDGAIGPDGPKGEQGEQGAVGPAGADGSKVYSGEGEPVDATGATGDYYFDVATGMLYGPKKVDNNWTDVDSFSLKGEDGADGADGADGSKILSGTGVPSGTTGNLGDYYLNKTTYTLYGPKRRPLMGFSTWGLGFELRSSANVKTFTLTVAPADWSISQNTTTISYKWGEYKAEFSALTEDLYNNGFVLVYWKNGYRLYPLPMTQFTSKKNILTRTFNLDSYGGTYSLSIKKTLEARNDATELLSFGTNYFRIKVVTGQAATALSAVKDNPEELMKAATEMGFID